MPASNDLPDRAAPASRDTQQRARDRSLKDGVNAHPEATDAALALSPTPPQPRKEIRRRIRRHTSTLPLRDRDVLLALARCRVLSFDQVRRMVFPDLSPQRVGQRLGVLAADGWLRIWEDVSRIGGHPRYALPTRRALAVALDRLSTENVGHASERLASRLLRAAPRRPLVLMPRVTPAFLAHQRECNDLLIAYRRIPDTRLLWATSFERPFPSHLREVALPQPDYVLILERAGTPTLIFGEHDRGHESLAHFRRTKAERYAALAARPALVRELFGFDRFAVWVTVLDARTHAPRRRLETLVRVAREAAASDVMAFTLAGWAVSVPAEPIWFCGGTAPTTRSVAGARDTAGLQRTPTQPMQFPDGILMRMALCTACVGTACTCRPALAAVVH
jgi:hypothetical protein